MKNWAEVVKHFEEMVDEGVEPMDVLGIKIYPAEALRKCDPTSFKTAVLNFAYGQGIDSRAFKDAIEYYL